MVLEKTLESSLDCKEIKPLNPNGNQSWIFFGGTDAEAETSILWPPDVKNWPIWKDPDAGNDRRQEEKGTIEDKMVGWHHWLNGHESEQALGVGDGQGNRACCSPWGHKELDTTECLNWIEPLPLSGNFFPSYCPDSRYLPDGSPDWKLQHLPKTSPPFLYYFPITPVTITTLYSLAIYYAEWLLSIGVLEFQLQHQSFQWTPRTDLL